MSFKSQQFIFVSSTRFKSTSHSFNIRGSYFYYPPLDVAFFILFMRGNTEDNNHADRRRGEAEVETQDNKGSGIKCCSCNYHCCYFFLFSCLVMFALVWSSVIFIIVIIIIIITGITVDINVATL